MGSESDVSEVLPRVSQVNTRSFPGEGQRDAAVRDCNLLDTPPEARFDAITRLVASIFGTPVSLLTLIVDDRVWFKSKVGPFGGCVARDGSWCNYILVPNRPEVLITEDASQDARFAANPYVMGEPHIRFYAGAPLISSGGERLGTLCVVDVRPRSFSAEMYSVLTQFASMAAAELERDAALQKHLLAEATYFADSRARVADAVATSLGGVAMIDVRAKPWPVLYANDVFARATSQTVPACTQRGFWQQFELVGADQGASRHIDTRVALGREVRLSARCRASRRQLSLVLRPAAGAPLCPDQPVGIPSWVRSERELGEVSASAGGGAACLRTCTSGQRGTIDRRLAACFYLVVVEEEEARVGESEGGQRGGRGEGAVEEGLAVEEGPTPPGTPALRDEPVACPAWPAVRAGSPAGGSGGGAGAGRRAPGAADVAGLPGKLALGAALGPLLGSGSFGKVYRGTLSGLGTVAIKAIDCDDSAPWARAVVAEAKLSQSLVHPNIVRVSKAALAVLAGLQCKGPPWTYGYEVTDKVMVNGQVIKRGVVFIAQQYCDQGTLIDAAEKGWFRVARSSGSPPSMSSMLRTLREVAAGMAFLHDKSIIHRDLTGTNVLLDSAPGDCRGFVARVCDFGLARLTNKGSIETRTLGTASHLAPEILTHDLITPAADVWSFGVLCWEMYCGSRAYAGMRPANIMFALMSGQARLQLPADAPEAFADLTQRCLCQDWERRPGFNEILGSLDAMLGKEER
ncbi:hypothetical protein N2152v2_001992 [Parachlorella kessleri]